jgi:hypothetical protein
MNADKSRFVVQMTDAELAQLDAVRARLGLRSKADVVRAWLAEEVANGLGHHGPNPRDRR